MKPEPAWITALIAVLAIGGQLCNLYLNLKLRNTWLEGERKLREEFVGQFRDAQVCEAIRAGFDRRIRVLEGPHEP